MKRAIVITGAEHYDPSSQTSREPDDEVLRQALHEKGIDVQGAVWNDSTVDWEDMANQAIVVVRSCWGYHHDREGFLAWCQRVASITTLLNPLAVLRWNTQKRYLLIQPYIDTVRKAGEHSLVFIAGEQTHAFRKRAVLCAESDSQGEHPIIPTSPEVQLAQKILRMAVKLLGLHNYSSLLFARVDLIDDAGTLRVMELELVEPRLRLADAPQSQERLVTAIAAHCAAAHAQPLLVAS